MTEDESDHAEAFVSIERDEPSVIQDIISQLAKHPDLSAMNDNLREHMERVLGEQLFGQPTLA